MRAKEFVAEQVVTEKNVPTNPSKWNYYKNQAKKKFDVYPSAYANAWAAKKYKAAGGKWKTESIQHEAEQSPYAIGMAKAMKMYKDKPPLKKKTIKKAHEIAKAVMKDDINQQADFEINFSKKMIDRGAREIYGKTGEDVEKMRKYYERRLVTWNGKKWKVYFDDAGYGAIDFLLVKPNDKYGSDPVATFNPFTKKVKELSMMKDDVNEEDLSNCKYGKYYCSTDKKYKCRQGPKQTRS